MMPESPLVSIIVNNYNYGRFLKEAVESALAQAYPRVEVIVVDDGSTDNSRQVIESFEDRITAVLKENGGQASALNAGFLKSRGEIVLFLDADDTLLPEAAARATARFEEGVVKVHWPLWAIGEAGDRTGQLVPGVPLPDGDLRETVRKEGPSSLNSPPTSGNAWSRWLLERILPVPESEFRLCADAYLFALAPAFGKVGSITTPLGCYRIHGSNNYRVRSFEEQVELGVRSFEGLCRAMARLDREHGLGVDLDAWKRNSFYHRASLALEEIERIIPRGHTFILVDDEVWGVGNSLAGRRRRPFLELEGRYWGPPADAATALKEVERLRGEGATFAVFAWPSFWWLEHYPGLEAGLRSGYQEVLRNERLAVFDLRRTG